MKKIRPLKNLVVISFFLHLFWENAQAPLYRGYESFSQHFFICLPGVLIDVAITLIIFLSIAALKNNSNWMSRATTKDYAVLALIGFLIGIGIEQNALLLNRWNYIDAMPLIPYFHVGVTPVVQMSVLLPLSFFILRRTHITHISNERD